MESKLVFVSELKGKVFDMGDDYVLCTGYCLVNDTKMNKLIHTRKCELCKDKRMELCDYRVDALVVEDDVYDAIRGKSVIEIDLESEIAKACNEVVNRYQQLSTMKDSASKEVVNEYCKKVETHLRVLLTIKEYMEVYLWLRIEKQVKK